MRSLRLVIGLSVVAFTSVAWTGTAFGTPPVNDNLATARPVSVGFGEQLDTREATTEPFDVEINGDCGAPASDATVWYSYTAGVETNVVVDASRSDYSVGILIIPDPAKGFEEPSCAPMVWGFTAAPGETYYIMAMDDQLDGSGHGGTLRIRFRKEPTPTLEFTIDPVDPVNTLTGKATVKGTYRCTKAGAIVVQASLQQQLAPSVLIFGSGPDFPAGGTCDGTRRVWSVRADPSNFSGGKLVAGDALAIVSGKACGVARCTYYPDFATSAQQIVRLRPRN